MMMLAEVLGVLLLLALPFVFFYLLWAGKLGNGPRPQQTVVIAPSVPFRAQVIARGPRLRIWVKEEFLIVERRHRPWKGMKWPQWLGTFIDLTIWVNGHGGTPERIAIGYSGPYNKTFRLSETHSAFSPSRYGGTKLIRELQVPMGATVEVQGMSFAGPAIRVESMELWLE